MPEAGIECTRSYRPWLKKCCSLYCFKEVTHFARHLEHNHAEEGAVRTIIAIPVKDKKRRTLLNALRRQGNYLYTESQNVIRPVGRPIQKINETDSNLRKEDYVICPNCFGYFKRNYLRRHRGKCSMRSNPKSGRENHLSEAQIAITCSGNYSKFYSSLRLKKEVYTIMRADEISKTAMEETLICSVAEELLGKHKRIQIKTVISNKMREGQTFNIVGV